MLFNPFSADVSEAMFDDNVNLILAVELLFQSGPTRVHSGTGPIEIENNTFLGIGTLGKVDTVKEQNTTSPTKLNLTLAGIETSSLSVILNENCVGRQASMYLGVLDEDFRLMHYDVIFRGKMRSTTVLAGSESAINITVSNIFEEWSHAKALRYTDECQRKLHDDDRIFRYVAQMADRSIYWGSKKDAPGFNYK